MLTNFMSWLGRMLHWEPEEPLLAAPVYKRLQEMHPEQVSYKFHTVPESEPTNAERLVAAAKAALGKDLSAGSGVPSYVACALSVNRVHYNAFGKDIGGGSSTHDLYKALLKHPSFREVAASEASPGTIIISPTGYGTKGMYPHGHVGIICDYGICANYSPTGLWTESYAGIAAWKLQFEVVEGYPTYYFQRI